MITQPSMPSITAVTPACARSSRPGTERTAGRPSARATIAVWLSAPPETAAKPATRSGSISAVSAGFDFALRDVVLRDRKIAALDDVGGADGDPGRNGEARQSLFGAGVLRRSAGDLLNPHQTCIRQAWRGPSPPPRLRGRWRR